MRQLQAAHDTALNLVRQAGQRYVPMIIRLWRFVRRIDEETDCTISKQCLLRGAGSRGVRGWSQGLTT